MGAFNQFLHNTETLFVSCQFLEVIQNHVENVLRPLFTESFDDFLDHVLALVVSRKLGDVVVLQKGLFHDFKLLFFSH
jgi:hypothetical protein